MGSKIRIYHFSGLNEILISKIKNIKREIMVTERQTDRQTEYATIINVSINDHYTKILFTQKVIKKR